MGYRKIKTTTERRADNNNNKFPDLVSKIGWRMELWGQEWEQSVHEKEKFSLGDY